jgi:hypothetical protein
MRRSAVRIPASPGLDRSARNVRARSLSARMQPGERTRRAQGLLPHVGGGRTVVGSRRRWSRLHDVQQIHACCCFVIGYDSGRRQFRRRRSAPRCGPRAAAGAGARGPRLPRDTCGPMEPHVLGRRRLQRRRRRRGEPLLGRVRPAAHQQEPGPARVPRLRGRRRQGPIPCSPRGGAPVPRIDDRRQPGGHLERARPTGRLRHRIGPAILGDRSARHLQGGECSDPGHRPLPMSH